jgi:hypothetical protein
MEKPTDINYIYLANVRSKGKRPYFFDDPAVERVLAITMAVAGELAVMHERLDTIERLLEAKGTLSRADIEAYRPTEEAAEQRQQWHAEYIARVLRIVQQEHEYLQNPDEHRDLADIAEELGRT